MSIKEYIIYNIKTYTLFNQSSLCSIHIIISHSINLFTIAYLQKPSHLQKTCFLDQDHGVSESIQGHHLTYQHAVEGGMKIDNPKETLKLQSITVTC